MKKVLALILCAAMLVGGMTFVASAEEVVDRAMLIDDISVEDTSTTGAMGYIVNNERENDYGVKAWMSEDPYSVFDQNGVAVAFDLNVIAYSECSHLVSDIDPTGFKHLSGIALTVSNERQALVYDIEEQEFQIATLAHWPVSIIPKDRSHILAPLEDNGSGVKEIVEKAVKFPMNPGEWHRVFLLVQGTEMFVYCDGELLLSHDFSGGAMGNLTRDFLMFWESHCRVMIDNIIVGTDEYDDNLGETFEEKIAANNDPENEVKNVLFADDMNDAIVPVWDHTEQVPVYETVKDARGQTVKDPVFEEDGITPKIGKDGKQEMQDRILLDDQGKPVQSVDDKGNPEFKNVEYFNKNGEVSPGSGQMHAGFVFGGGVQTDSTKNVPCYGVDKDKYCGMIKDYDNAVISFADTGAVEGQTVNAAITVSNGVFTTATGLTLSIDPIFTFKGFENVAEGAEITEADGKVNVTLPAGFSGKLCDMVLEIPAENEMAQSCRYRYGFIAGADAEFKNGSDSVDAATVTIDGGFTNTVNFIKGDCNNDGKVNAKDVTSMMKYILILADVKKGKKLSETSQKLYDTFSLKAGDVFPNGAINARDVQVLMVYLVTGEWRSR